MQHTNRPETTPMLQTGQLKRQGIIRYKQRKPIKILEVGMSFTYTNITFYALEPNRNTNCDS